MLRYLICKRRPGKRRFCARIRRDWPDVWRYGFKKCQSATNPEIPLAPLSSTGVSKGGGFKPPPGIFFNCVYAKYTVQVLLLCSLKILNFVQENVKNCMLNSHFASASGRLVSRRPTAALPLDPIGWLPLPRLPDPARHHMNHLYCKILGMLMNSSDALGECLF